MRLYRKDLFASVYMACASKSIICLLSFVLGLVSEKIVDFGIQTTAVWYTVPVVENTTDLLPLHERLMNRTVLQTVSPLKPSIEEFVLETKVGCVVNNWTNKVMHWDRAYINPSFNSSEFDWINKTKLENRWIYLVGDSSLRMFFRALIHVIEPTFADPHFGSYLIHDKGGCVSEEDGHLGGGCLREYFNRDMRLRITFSFKTFADQPSLALDWLISESQKPDIIVGATGAWDIYFEKLDLGKSVGWFRHIAEVYSASLILAVTLVSCPPFRAVATEHNSVLVRALLDQNFSNLAVLDRQASTGVVEDEAVCQGFHAYGSLTLLHIHAFLANIEINYK